MPADCWTDLERAVMTLLLAGDDPVLGILREQFQHARLKSREMTGVGIYTDFTVPSDIPGIPGLPRFCFGDVEASIPPAEHGAGFLLWITDGRLNSLESYSYDEPWPDAIEGFTVCYIGGGRDLGELRTAWIR